MVRRVGHWKHNKMGTPVYGCWARMLQRCNNIKDDAYPNYGGRGIKVCTRWRTFLNFYSDMGDPPPGTSIERDDNDGPYDPSNCRWATKPEQMRNRRTSVWIEFEGRRQLQSEWAAELGLHPTTLMYRLRHWPIEKVLQRKET